MQPTTQANPTDALGHRMMSAMFSQMKNYAKAVETMQVSAPVCAPLTHGISRLDGWMDAVATTSAALHSWRLDALSTCELFLSFPFVRWRVGVRAVGASWSVQRFALCV
jgi:hypothetical protein